MIEAWKKGVDLDFYFILAIDLEKVSKHIKLGCSLHFLFAALIFLLPKCLQNCLWRCLPQDVCLAIPYWSSSSHAWRWWSLSALHSWVMPTPSFLEFIMFSRYQSGKSMLLTALNQVLSRLKLISICSLNWAGCLLILSIACTPIQAKSRLVCWVPQTSRYALAHVWMAEWIMRRFIIQFLISHV